MAKCDIKREEKTGDELDDKIGNERKRGFEFRAWLVEQ